MLFPKPTYKRRPKPKVIKIKMQSCKECWVCHGDYMLEKHHAFGAANRDLSELYGLWAYFCHNHHNENIPGDAGIHFNKPLRKKFQRIAQSMFEAVYSNEKFLEVFGQNYT